MSTHAGPLTIYVGTYTQEHDDKEPTGASEGIYTLRFDPATGGLEVTGSDRVPDNPCFLAFHPGGRRLYSIHEVWDRTEHPGGAASAFDVNPETGRLTLLNRVPSGGGLPCHLSLDKTLRFLLVANYGGGSVSVFSLNADGSVGERAAGVQHEGSSANQDRQQEPHPHSFFVDPGNAHALVPDLGLDRVMVYDFDAAAGSVSPSPTPWVTTAPGAGPRHFDFLPGGRHAYVANELNSTVTAFGYNGETGVLTELQTLSTLPAGFDGMNHPADLHVHPSGRFLYASNRGHDSIAMYRIDQGSGRLEHIGNEHTQGDTPRNFTIDPTGGYLIAGNQRSDTVVTFSIDQESGELEPTGCLIPLPAPACHLFAPAP